MKSRINNKINIKQINNKQIYKYNFKINGYITAEACICIPIFMFIILFFGTFIRMYIAREVMQHALIESSAKIIFYTEVLWETGIINQFLEIEENVDERTKVNLQEFLKSVLDNINLPLKKDKHYTNPQCEDFLQIFDFIFENFYCSSKEKVFNQAYEYLIMKQVVKSLENQYKNKTESILNKLGIYQGTKGLNFNGSYISLLDQNKLKICLAYKYSTGVPFKGLDKIQVKQHLICNLWMDGDETLFNLESGYQNESKEENIWLLNNFERGRKIRKIFGANLPIGYQGISKFVDGKATLIKSMDLTAETYTDCTEVSKRIKIMIDQLINFKGNERPWGSQKITINEKDIIQKELLLVIPKDNVKFEIQKELEFLQHYAYLNNITLTIVKYGYKNVNETEIQKSEEVH